MNAEKPPAAWWSWAPRFPRRAIIIAAVSFDLIIIGTARYNYLDIQLNSQQATTLPLLIEAFIDRSIAGNAVALLMFLQLNLEILHMIFSLKANWSDVQKAKAEAHAQAKAWFELYKADPDNAPPPPWSTNRKTSGQHRHPNPNPNPKARQPSSCRTFAQHQITANHTFRISQPDPHRLYPHNTHRHCHSHHHAYNRAATSLLSRHQAILQEHSHLALPGQQGYNPFAGALPPTTNLRHNAT